MRIAIINGPNLNLLGKREPEIYGEKGFKTFRKELHEEFPDIEFSYFQSNVEGELIDELQRIGFLVNGIVFNAGGYTHTSVAIGDAIASISSPVIEVHISNVHAREEYRHQSLMAKHCKGIITGFGLDSYRLAIKAFISESVK